VDYAVRGQGEDTLIELLEAQRGLRSLDGIRGLSYKSPDGEHHHNPERLLKGPDAFPWYPYHRIPAEKYILPSFFGRRTAVHHASIGCPFQCSFCGIGAAFGGREEMESPARTEAILRHLVDTYGVDSIQFCDMNFFLREDQARELADRLAPLHLRWWCEARIDIMLRYSDQTFDALRRAGCAMIYYGAESGSDWVLKEMKKQLTTAQALELAARIRLFNIIPEFSFCIGNPMAPEEDAHQTIRFIRQIKEVNPATEIIMNHYVPVPQPDRMYGNVESQIRFPATPEEWATERWLNFTLRTEPQTPWLTPATKCLDDNFRTVVSSRWPTVQDLRLPSWGRLLLKALSAWRYRLEIYSSPVELRWVQRMLDLRKPEVESV
jgi:anaerobic magnesium-protoporphyrin IX monomethyl ester cyclase